VLLPATCLSSMKAIVFRLFPLPLFWVALQRNLLICLVTPGSASGSTSACPCLWSEETLPACWPVCKRDLTLSVFLVAFNVLTSIAACRLPLCQCIAIAVRIFVLSVSFIVPSVVQCYLAPWLSILSIAQPMMRLQRGAMFHIAWSWNLWGIVYVSFIILL